MKGFRFLIGLLALGSLLMVPVGAQALPVSGVQITDVQLEITSGELSLVFPIEQQFVRASAQVTENDALPEADEDSDGNGVATIDTDSGSANAAASFSVDSSPSWNPNDYGFDLSSVSEIMSTHSGDSDISVQSEASSGIGIILDSSDSPVEMTVSFNYEWFFELPEAADEASGFFQAGLKDLDNPEFFYGIKSSDIEEEELLSGHGIGTFSHTIGFEKGFEGAFLNLETESLLSATLLGEEAPVPEPGTWLLLSLGVAGLPLLYRRRKQG